MTIAEDQFKSWMAGGLDGDPASHAALLRALVPLPRAYYRRQLGADAETEDLLQETLIAVHTRRASYDRGRPFTAWLFAIARYKLVDHLRRLRRTVPLDEAGDVFAVDGFEDRSGAAIDVGRLPGTLPPKQAGAIRRTRPDGLSTAEAATVAGIGGSDVKVPVHRGLKGAGGPDQGRTAVGTDDLILRASDGLAPTPPRSRAHRLALGILGRGRRVGRAAAAAVVTSGHR